MVKHFAKSGVQNCSNAEKPGNLQAVELLDFTKEYLEVLERGIKERNPKIFSLDLSNSVHFLEIRSAWSFVRMQLYRKLLFFSGQNNKAAEKCCVIEKYAFHALTWCQSKLNLATYKLGP